MIISHIMPIPEDEQWTDDAVQNLVGQKGKLTHLGVTTSCVVVNAKSVKPGIEIEMEIDDSLFLQSWTICQKTETSQS